MHRIADGNKYGCLDVMLLKLFIDILNCIKYVVDNLLTVNIINACYVLMLFVYIYIFVLKIKIIKIISIVCSVILFLLCPYQHPFHLLIPV